MNCLVLLSLQMSFPVDVLGEQNFSELYADCGGDGEFGDGVDFLDELEKKGFEIEILGGDMIKITQRQDETSA